MRKKIIYSPFIHFVSISCIIFVLAFSFVYDANAAPSKPWLYPILSAKRTVTRVNNVYQVDVELKNSSSISTIEDIVVTDTSTGFQCVDDAQVIWKGYPPCEVHGIGDEVVSSYIKVTFPTPWTLGPGESMLLRYHVVPIMYHSDTLRFFIRRIGSQLKITYTINGNNYVRDITHLSFTPTDVSNAFHSADYLLLTSPDSLYQNYIDNDVDKLLGTMARLAKYKDGVLAYGKWLSYADVRKKIGWGGSWSNALKPGWIGNGYLLIVGEKNIVPHRPDFDVQLGDNIRTITMSDYFYADLFRFWFSRYRPEVRVGRIVGKNPVDLRQPLLESLKVLSGQRKNDGSDAFLISGHEKISDKFPLDAVKGAEYLNTYKGVNAYHSNMEYFTWDEKILHKAIIHTGAANGGFDKSSKGCNPRPCPDANCLNDYTKSQLEDWVLSISGGTNAYTEARNIENTWRGLNLPYFILTSNATADAFGKSVIRNNIDGKDLIMYSGHASGAGWSNWGWADVQSANLLSNETCPIVFSFGCSAGNYPGNSISTSFLKYGAAAFAGATQMINTDDGRRHMREHGMLQFYAKNKRIGDIHFDWKVHLGKNSIQSGLDKRLLYVFNLYGDPKFGGPNGGAGAASRSKTVKTVAVAPPAITLFTVPDYVVTELDGVDYCEIPGGQLLALNIGDPIVPYWQHEIEFTGNYKIQNVTMLSRMNSQSESGLILPIVDTDPDDLSPTPPPNYPFPTDDFDWEVYYGENGEPNTLVISAYPFYVNSTRVLFFKDYEFQIDSIQSNVSITNLGLEHATYALGDIVKVDVELFNGGAPQDVRVLANIVEPLSEDVKDELPTLMIENLTLTGTLTMNWSSGAKPPGEYEVDVRARNLAGQELDRQRVPFRLGIISGKVKSLTVSPQHFSVHDILGLDLGFENDGESDYYAKCVFQISTADELVDEFWLDPVEVAAGTSTEFHFDWDTSGTVENEIYYVVGSVQFEGMASNAMSVACSTNLMPIPDFVYTPDKAEPFNGVSFDASTSSDPDGSIVSYAWEFDDGGTSDDSITSHTYYQPGEYEVALTVIDDNNGTSTTVKVIQVTEPSRAMFISRK